MYKKDIIKIPINHKEKIILLSDLEYFISPKNRLFFRDDLDGIKKNTLYQIINLLHTKYPNFSFWWLDAHESASPISLWNSDGLENLREIFLDYKIEDKLFFIDNNLGECKYESVFNVIHGPFLIGFTSDRGFEIKERKFEKKFICLNRRPKPHRKDTFYFLRENYLQDSYLSYLPGHSGNKDRMVFDGTEGMKYGTLDVAWPLESQKLSFCNIVTESLWWGNSIHITEKTDKCFSAGQPFVLVSGHGYLKKLKELGFKTFDKWWDESYDLEIDYEFRIEKIKNTINHIGSFSLHECELIYKDMIPTLKHNQDLAKSFKNDLYHFFMWDDYELITFKEKRSIF